MAKFRVRKHKLLGKWSVSKNGKHLCLHEKWIIAYGCALQRAIWDKEERNWEKKEK